MNYDDVLLKQGWTLEHEMHDGGKWYAHPEKGDITVEPDGRWEWSRPNGTSVKGLNPKDLERRLSKGESFIAKTDSLLLLLEQTTDPINDYFDSFQSYFAPSDWQKITSLLRKTIGIPFYQFKNSVSDNMLGILAKQNVPGNTIGQETYFFYYAGVHNNKPYVIGGFGDPAEEPPKYLMVRKSDQIKWKEEFQGKLEDYNRLNLPTQDIPHRLQISIGEPVGGHDMRRRETFRPSKRHRKSRRKRPEAVGIAAGGYGAPVTAFSNHVNYVPKGENMSKVKRLMDLLLEVEDDEEDDEEVSGSKSFYRFVDLDERGSYRAHVEDKDGKIVFSYNNEDEENGEEGELWLVTDGFMRHVDDLAGLEEYLKDVKIIPKDASLYDGEKKVKGWYRR